MATRTRHKADQYLTFNTVTRGRHAQAPGHAERGDAGPSAMAKRTRHKAAQYLTFNTVTPVGWCVLTQPYRSRALFALRRPKPTTGWTRLPRVNKHYIYLKNSSHFWTYTRYTKMCF